MGQGHSNSRTLGSLGRFPKLQNDLRLIYRNLHPTKTRTQSIEWAATLESESRIQAVVGEFEIEVFGVGPDGKLNNLAGNNIPARVERLKRKLNIKTNTQVV
jgi:hypothetical protein